MASEVKSLCIYCGAATGVRPAYAEAARDLGRRMAQAGIRLVYGGGKVGLMGIIADAVLAHGGEVIGIIPKALMEREVGHTGLTQLHVVENMHQRKQMMADLSDAFIAMPGGIGTCEELFEVFTWLQIGYHAKPIGLLNVEQYYDPLIVFLKSMVTEQFLKAPQLDQLQISASPEALLDTLRQFTPSQIDRWTHQRSQI
ncbi:TIGR00730 family Rossman fold protein [Pandoraea soli]|uniref:Cytokinin riboside 5'-monophosphate phosphoribohydrolase n=1 Tax=Pandoraea soli TaxID=2508293 RepID=A0ABY6VP85_9BURK|nr:TIGR00730 family Rossman fold protein [Pandoraea soli]VVD70933.1 LOG family protein YvdD [Pandoraea soli]